VGAPCTSGRCTSLPTAGARATIKIERSCCVHTRDGKLAKLYRTTRRHVRQRIRAPALHLLGMLPETRGSTRSSSCSTNSRCGYGEGGAAAVRAGRSIKVESTMSPDHPRSRPAPGTQHDQRTWGPQQRLRGAAARRLGAAAWSAENGQNGPTPSRGARPATAANRAAPLRGYILWVETQARARSARETARSFLGVLTWATRPQGQRRGKGKGPSSSTVVDSGWRSYIWSTESPKMGDVFTPHPFFFPSEVPGVGVGGSRAARKPL